MRVLILDEIVVKAGLADSYRRAYREQYMPKAQLRGMQLEGAWQNPPGQDFDELPTTLYYLWSVAGVEGWWKMRLSRNADGSDQRDEKHTWWQQSDAMTLRRKRQFLTDQPEGG